MKNKEDNSLDELIGKVLKQAPLESPSKDFTANILSKIEALPQSTVFVYKPLISKKAWFIIGVLILGLTTYLLLGTPTEKSGWLSTIDFTYLQQIKTPKLFTGIEFPKTLVYSIVIFAALLFVQIPFLKKEFDKRLSY